MEAVPRLRVLLPQVDQVDKEDEPLQLFLQSPFPVLLGFSLHVVEFLTGMLTHFCIFHLFIYFSFSCKCFIQLEEIFWCVIAESMVKVHLTL